jgi:hypothetical protein
MHRLVGHGPPTRSKRLPNPTSLARTRPVGQILPNATAPGPTVTMPRKEVEVDPAVLTIFLIAILIVAAIAVGAARRRR